MMEDRKIDISGAIFITRCLTDPQSGEVFANHQTALVWLLNSVRLIIVLKFPIFLLRRVTVRPARPGVIYNNNRRLRGFWARPVTY
jgi:hypothetical protein